MGPIRVTIALEWTSRVQVWVENSLRTIGFETARLQFLYCYPQVLAIGLDSGAVHICM